MVNQEADVTSLHPLPTPLTRNMICCEQFLQMKKDALINNTSRRGIINEDHPYKVITEEYLGRAAIDIFENALNTGKLVEIDRFLLTAHMGSMSTDCRPQMEIEETDEVINFLKGYPLKREIPQLDSEMQG